jgi:hypothetical protein
MEYPQTRHNNFFWGQSQAAYLWEMVWEPLVTRVYGYGNWLFTRVSGSNHFLGIIHGEI